MSQRLRELEVEVGKELKEILSGAQGRVREAQKMLAGIPEAYRFNGLKGALEFMDQGLERVDEKFVEGYRSVDGMYGEETE